MFKTTVRSALLLSSLALFQPAVAQNLPGVAIDTATVAAELQTLLNLAQSAYPSSVPAASASGWRLYQGYTFKYYSATGIYVGIKDGQVYLLGGPYTQITPYGAVAAVTSALQTRIAANANTAGSATTADFGGVVAAKTLADLKQRFSLLTMEWTAAFGATRTTSQIKLEVLGPETINGVNTDKMKITVTGNGSSLAYDMWVNDAGKTVRVALGSFVYPDAQAEILGASAVSGFLIALAAGDNPQLQAALSGELNNGALSTKVTQRTVGTTTVPTVQLTVAANGANITGYYSDFGSFTMLTQFSSTVSVLSNSFEVIDMKLR
jgi:hypothetical protein